MTGSYAYGLWSFVAINALFFIIFAASFLLPRRKREWRSLGVFSAFVVALFAEMYGFPLTIYFLTSLLGSSYPATKPFSHTRGHLWATLTGWKYATLICTFGSLLMLAGLFLLGAGWKRIHRAKGELVTGGVYRYVRHPQYGGLILITIGMLIQWPTIVTFLMWPILMAVYYRLAKKEEKELQVKFGNEYLEYKKKVPAFIPKIYDSRFRFQGA